MKQVSFVIPAYNCANTLEEAVASVFDKNYTAGDEIIIVDDASTDDTATVLEKLKTKWPNIQVITNQKNLGCPASRNVGIRAAKNELIFNLDSDDVLETESVPKLKSALITEQADIASFAEARFFSHSTKKISHRWIYRPGVITFADLLAGFYNPSGSTNFLYTKASWEKIGGYDEYGKGLNEGWGFTIKQVGNGAKLFAVKDTYYFHRAGHNSLYIRENRDPAENSRMATKMIRPFFPLISDEDVAYVQANENTWFNNLNTRPLHPKHGPQGKNGSLQRTLTWKVVKAGFARIIGFKK